MRKFVGIDVAATSGYAFIASSGHPDRASNWWEVGTVRATSAQKHDVLAHAKEHGCTHVVLEKPAPFKLAGAWQIETYGAMRESYGRWLEACMLADMEVVPCHVATWQAAVLRVNGQSLKGNGKEGSLYVAKLNGATCKNSDEADAVCLCLAGEHALAKAAEKEETKRATRNLKARARRKKA
jgi:hypothetical protein